MRRLTVLLLGLLLLWAVPFVAHPLGVSGGGGGCADNCTFTGQTQVSGGDSGVTPSVTSELFVEDDAVTQIQIATTNTQSGQLLFADPEHAGAGSITYDHATNQMTFGTDGIGSLYIGATGKVSTFKACVSGFVRVGPNYCRKIDDAFTTIWNDTTACTALTPYVTLPTDATHVDLSGDWWARSNNAVALRGNSIRFYDDTACTAPTSAYGNFKTYEQVALAAGTVIATFQDHFDYIPLINESGVMKVRFTEQNAGGNGNAELNDYSIRGYYD